MFVDRDQSLRFVILSLGPWKILYEDRILLFISSLINIQIGLATLLVERRVNLGPQLFSSFPNYVCLARTPCRHSPWPAVRKRMVGCLMCGDMWRAVSPRISVTFLRFSMLCLLARTAWLAWRTFWLNARCSGKKSCIREFVLAYTIFHKSFPRIRILLLLARCVRSEPVVNTSILVVLVTDDSYSIDGGFERDKCVLFIT